MIIRILLLFLSPRVVCSSEERIFGFNYGAYWTNSTAKTSSDFKQQFEKARTVAGRASMSARLFTTTQAGTTDSFIEAIQPAIETETSLLLGMWPRYGRIDHELVALNKALDRYGQGLVDLIVGISVGNEDLHRASDGCNPDCADALTIKDWINTVRSNLTSGAFGAAMSTKKIGHVETVLSWSSQDTAVNDLISVCDFVGVTIYPFWGGVPVEHGAESFFSVIEEAKSVGGTKPIFIAETGWPWAGEEIGMAEVGVQSMQLYWDTVACHILAQYDSWWYQFEDDAHDGYLWGISDITTGQVRFDITCPNSVQQQTSLPITTTTTSEFFAMEKAIYSTNSDIMQTSSMRNTNCLF